MSTKSTLDIPRTGMVPSVRNICTTGLCHLKNNSSPVMNPASKSVAPSSVSPRYVSPPVTGRMAKSPALAFLANSTSSAAKSIQLNRPIQSVGVGTVDATRNLSAGLAGTVNSVVAGTALGTSALVSGATDAVGSVMAGSAGAGRQLTAGLTGNSPLGSGLAGAGTSLTQGVTGSGASVVEGVVGATADITRGLIGGVGSLVTGTAVGTSSLAAGVTGGRIGVYGSSTPVISSLESSVGTVSGSTIDLSRSTIHDTTSMLKSPTRYPATVSSSLAQSRAALQAVINTSSTAFSDSIKNTGTVFQTSSPTNAGSPGFGSSLLSVITSPFRAIYNWLSPSRSAKIGPLV